MAPVIFVETLDAKGAVKGRERLTSFPAGLGRSYQNAVIVDDPYVCPQHARILQAEDGTLELEDLGSLNGTYAMGGTERLVRIPLRSATRVRLGHTVLCLCTADQPVAPAVRDVSRRSAAARAIAQRPPLSLSVIGVTAMAFVVGETSAATETLPIVEGLALAFGLLMVLSLWAGGWSFANRHISHRFQFLQHLALACGGALAIAVLSLATDYYQFVAPPGWLGSPVNFLIGWGLLGGMLYGHFWLLPAMKPRRRGVVAGAIALLFALIGHAVWLEDTEFSSEVSVVESLRPVSTGWLQTMSLDDYLMETDELRQAIDASASW